MANKDNKTKPLAEMDDDDDVIPQAEPYVETEMDAADLDWRHAAQVLKKRMSELTDSIDDYFTKVEVNALRERYNAKERSVDLHSAIMKLEV